MDKGTDENGNVLVDTSDLSIVVPVYNEGDNIPALFEGIRKSLGTDAEILICYDFEEDNTLPPAREQMSQFPNTRLVKNKFGRGPLGAIKSGFMEASHDAVLVTMADLSDSLDAVPSMLDLHRQGYDLVAGSRYMRGGRQIGGPMLKGMLSRFAGTSLYYVGGIPTHDATNSFKLYSKKLLDSITIESNGGFELAIELTVKAHAKGFSISEVPSTWTDRTAGESRFNMRKWLPKYLHWYFMGLFRIKN